MTTTRRHRMPAGRKTRTITRVGRAAVLAATALGLAAGTAAPAAATTPAAPTATAAAQSEAATFANLQIIGVGGGQYRIIVDGVFAMTQYDAQGFLNNLGSRGGMQYRIMGFDGLSQEERGTTYYSGPSMPGTHAGGWLYAGTDGIHFHREFQVSGSVLNEDSGWWEDPADTPRGRTPWPNQPARSAMMSSVVISQRPIPENSGGRRATAAERKALGSARVDATGAAPGRPPRSPRPRRAAARAGRQRAQGDHPPQGGHVTSPVS